MAVRRCRQLFLVSSLGFLLLYAFAVGMIFWVPFPIPESIPVPLASLILQGPIGQVPWLVVYLNRHWIISVSLEAGLAALLLSVLFGLNVSSLLYASSYRSCRLPQARVLSGLAILPSVFATFSCCGGGLVLTMLLAAGFTGFATGLLLPYARPLVALTASLLLLNLWLIYRRVRVREV